jgi:hypothetical protein
MTGATSNHWVWGFPRYIARSGATLWVAAARAGDKQADDDTPTNACPHLNLIRVGIDADKVLLL